MPDDSSPAPSFDLDALTALLGRVADDRGAFDDVADDVAALLEAAPAGVRDLLVRQAQRQAEASLVYRGKRPEGEILADPRVAPLQTVHTFGDAAEGEWVNQLIFGDNVGVLRHLLRLKDRGELTNADGTAGIRCVYIDPPFATERDFQNKTGDVAYADRKDGAQFIEFLRERLVLLRELLADDGTLWVHLDSHKVHYVKVVLDEVFGAGHFQSEVVWQRSKPKGNKTMRRPGRQHDTILMYTKSATDWVWNRQYEDYDPKYLKRFKHVDPKTGRRFRADGSLVSPGNDGYRYTYKGVEPPEKGWRCPESTMRALDEAGDLVFPSTPGGTIFKKLYPKEGVVLQDLWANIAPVQDPRYPTEKPQALLERVIVASSNPGDLVLDCFAGSGSTLRAAERLGRRWIGVDAGKLAIHTATRDLLTTRRDDGTDRAPFAVVHAALYDHDQLLEQSFDDWCAFVLALYGAQPRTEHVGDLRIHGRRGVRNRERVIVHDWDTDPDVVIDDQYLRDLHDLLARHIKVGVVSVIIPQHLAPTLIADNYRVGQLEVRILRVPPSMAAAAADGAADGFAELTQPQAEDHVNALIRSEGFDFVIQPLVRRTCTVVRGKPRITLTSFTADGRRSSKTPLPADGRDDLALVLIDYEHVDFERNFDFEDAIWAHTLEAATPAWSLTLDPSALSKPVGITWVDRFGNELREVIRPEEWDR